MSKKQIQGTKPPATHNLTLDELYAIGRELRMQSPKKSGTYAKGVIADAAEERHLSEGHMHRARSFAREYTKSEFDALKKLRMPDRRRLGVGHVVVLIRVKDKAKRRRLEVQCAKEGWSARRLNRKRQLLCSITDRMLQGGRPPHAPHDEAELRIELVQRANEWCRWAKAAEMQLSAAGGKKASSKAAKAMRKAVTAAKDATAKMQLIVKCFVGD